jgi:putative intracellular protease/amidase/uncharacterized protein (DUF952 family)
MLAYVLTRCERRLDVKHYGHRVKFLYHILPKVVPFPEVAYAPASLASEGFIHASYAGAVAESAALYFAQDAKLRVWQVDPLRVRRDLKIANTPRGPMPHIHGPIPRDAIVAVHDVGGPLASNVQRHRVAMVAFGEMTLLDFALPYDALRRLSSVEITTVLADVPYERDGIRVSGALRPALDGFDVLVVPGGLGVSKLLGDKSVTDWIASFPRTRLLASVCTGSLLLGAVGRLQGRRATTHRDSFSALRAYGVNVDETCRIVDDGDVITGGGVTCGLEVGLALVEALAGADERALVASAMHVDARASE